MDDAKEYPPPGANRGRASKERSKNSPSLPQPNNSRQRDSGNSRAAETAPPETDPSPDPFDLVEAQKTDLAAAPEEVDVKEAEAFVTSRTAVGDGDGTGSAVAAAILKPSGFDLNRFKSKRADAIANVDTLQTGLPVMAISQAKDFVRLHPDEDNYWSPELCFVMVPIKGSKRDSLHLIEEDLAMRYLPSGKILRFRLALATKPYDVFFLCRIPTRNLDNSWNRDNVAACEQAKTLWTQATSRGEEGVDGYLIERARDLDAFPEPEWPKQTLSDLIDRAFAGRTIVSEDHPALLRLIGAKQSVS
jgi:hypothetical protein